ncbi:hypothetical protein MLD38_032134 [Melastoma candidum]|uniref:Uncharacterized protein n=1 Tax=Melastoma candidum TaxID=119954 RepID=A0ACB9M4J1_9MYRT|nr:hypothetical protein MLD38_032134 [Melastoma candidum]
MSAVFRMKAAGDSISSLLRGRPLSRFSGGTAAPWTPSTAVRFAPGKRAYLKSPDRPGKTAELDVSPGALSYSSRLVGWYMGMVQSRPILTKSISCSCIYTASDLSSQAIMGPSLESYDPKRTLRMAGYGMVVLGPVLHFWFSVMSKFFPNRDLASTLKKMALGQVIFGPVMTAVFFSINATLQGEKRSEVVARLKRDLFPTLVNGIMYWPLCDFITFRFIPVHLQPLMSNGFSYVWTIYLSYIASRTKECPCAKGGELWEHREVRGSSHTPNIIEIKWVPEGASAAVDWSEMPQSVPGNAAAE